MFYQNIFSLTEEGAQGVEAKKKKEKENRVP